MCTGLMFILKDERVYIIGYFGLVYNPALLYWRYYMNVDKYLKVKDIQKILDCSEKKAYAIIKKKSFPKIKIGKQYYIPIDAFKKWENTYIYKELQI